MENNLKAIPGVGKNMEQHLINAGYPDISSPKSQDPEKIYLKDCVAQGEQVDRCALYVYRLAVHYANHDGTLPPDKQNWWDWQDK